MENMQDPLDILSKTMLFRGLKRTQLKHLAKRFVERKYESEQAMVRQDEGGEGFFIIVSGKAQALRMRLDGKEEKVNEFGPGDFFGELALLDDGPRTASVVAVEPTTCLVLARWDFLTALHEDVDTAIIILQEMARRFRAALDVL